MQQKIIMVVDDEAALVRLVAYSLQMANFKVLQTFSGAEALATLEKSELPDLFILDIMMPGMNGFELCQKLRSDQRTKSIPIIMLTAMEQKNDAEKAIALGADDYLIKPFDPLELGQQINDFLQEHPNR
jgi:DNA-binding response OmpR family regulator